MRRFENKRAVVTGGDILVDGGMQIGLRHSWEPEMPGLFESFPEFAA